MAKCGNCGIDFQSKSQLVRHNMDVHETVFLEGSEDLVKIQEKLATEDTSGKYRKLIDKKTKESE